MANILPIFKVQLNNMDLIEFFRKTQISLLKNPINTEFLNQLISILSGFAATNLACCLSETYLQHVLLDDKNHSGTKHLYDISCRNSRDKHCHGDRFIPFNLYECLLPDLGVAVYMYVYLHLIHHS